MHLHEHLKVHPIPPVIKRLQLETLLELKIGGGQLTLRWVFMTLGAVGKKVGVESMRVWEKVGVESMGLGKKVR